MSQVILFQMNQAQLYQQCRIKNESDQSVKEEQPEESSGSDSNETIPEGTNKSANVSDISPDSITVAGINDDYWDEFDEFKSDNDEETIAQYLSLPQSNYDNAYEYEKHRCVTI